MAQGPGIKLTAFRRTGNRLGGLATGFGGKRAALVDLPGPRSLGSLKIGQDFLEGNCKFAGRLVMAPGISVWDIKAPDNAFRADMHGFGWLDHVLAVASPDAFQKAQVWVSEWISSFGNGHGLAWAPEVLARRLMRWLHHYDELTRKLPSSEKMLLDRQIWRQAVYLQRRWKLASDAKGRIEALATLQLVRRVIVGLGDTGAAGGQALMRELMRLTAGDGTLVSRNPEELLGLLNLINWAVADMQATGVVVPSDLIERQKKMARVLRSLRHSDGALARFQGGGRGVMFGLDQALAGSGARGHEPDGGMGFVRMASGRTSLIVDAAPPAANGASFNAHASTLAMELTSGQRPMIVSCGAGAPFGPEWRKAGRATPSHSVLGLDGYSSSRLGRSREIMGQSREPMETRPASVPVQMERHLDYLRIEASHDGYLRSHGMLQGRALELTVDGSAVAGEEVLLSESTKARAKFDKIMDGLKGEGIPFTLRFHLHPDVATRLDPETGTVQLLLKSGEVWDFRHDGGFAFAMESSVYLDSEATRPTATKQMVLSGRATTYTTRIRWSLAKTPESLKGIRDLAALEADPID
ncbi:MAG: heparinase II/III family protein [Paracoccaceae bacterium]|jgi:uncharacterized heparinase superfamily protein|nr:heparinase II/III family protein [Paracoccaceae bacterium]MDP7185139.1 heparinase II/III family protein [Paracoccaceae bacterium]